VSARSRELFALIPAGLLVTAGFLAVFLSQESLKGVGGQDELTDASLTYGGSSSRCASPPTWSSGCASSTPTRTSSRSWRSSPASAW
jgi:hypothetical protein